MDKRTISFLKKKFPFLFSKVIQSPFLSRLASELDRGRYVYCLLNKKPYFGTVALAGQTWEERKPAMRKLVGEEIKRNVKSYFEILEIGSWAGNSAVLWADAIKSNQCRGIVLCVDPWQPYVKKENNEKINSATILMNHALQNDKIFKLFLHNVKTSNHADMIYPLKGNSDQILPFLRHERFDMIYVDGDHSYSGIKKDLQNTAGLVREGGILCGDDMDIDINAIDREYAEQNKETNIIIDPKTNKSYHPGVCLAVTEFFKSRVTSYEGFWAMRKVGNSWKEVILTI